MENQNNKNALQLNDLSALYETIFFIFRTNKGEHCNFCWTELLKQMYHKNSVELTIVNEDDPKKTADCQLMRTANICLSEDKQAIVITQKPQNKKTEQILMHLDGEKIMVSKKLEHALEIVWKKKFVFKKEKYETLPKYEGYDFNKEEIINEKDNKNQNGPLNNSNIYI